MDRNYILSSFFLTMSCTTTALGTVNISNNYSICPENSVIISTEVNQPYLLSSTTSSYLESLPTNEDMEDFNRLAAFGENFLKNEIGIGRDIQKIINDNFWDML